VLGDPDQPHSYTFVPDIGEGPAMLGEHPDAGGEVWHLPNDPDTRTTRELSNWPTLAGQPRGRVRQVPQFLPRLAAVRDRTVREIREMRYPLEEHQDRRSAGVRTTPVERALADTLVTYRSAPVTTGRA
jgi:nucleoside-diphosphate-sugar epimerase